MKYIKVQVIKPVNIIENLKTHIKEISSLVLKEEIESLDDKNEDIIKSKNEIKPKDILYDGGDDIIFIGKEFEPKYRYYKKEDSLIIEIELCSDYSGLSVKQQFDKNTKETLFKITGERKIDSGENKEIYYTFGNKRENYKRFKLELKIKLKELGIGHLKEGYKEVMKFGILFLDFKFNK
jgi:HSP20 family molecular chaperone IbpA